MLTAAVAPAGVGAPVQYGPRTKAIVSYLMAGQGLAQARCAQAMADLFGVALSEVTVAAVTADTAAGLDTGSCPTTAGSWCTTRGGLRLLNSGHACLV